MSNGQLYKYLTDSEKKAAALEAAARVYEGCGNDVYIHDNANRVIALAKMFEEYLKEK